MTDPQDINLSGAEAAFAVANTPSYLLRKLRADPAIHEAARKYSFHELLRALKLSINKEPKTLSDLVRPYVYLVALYGAGHENTLEKAKSMSAPCYKWFSQIANTLSVEYVPTTQVQIRVTAVSGKPQILDKSQSSTAHIKLKLPSG